MQLKYYPSESVILELSKSGDSESEDEESKSDQRKHSEESQKMQESQAKASFDDH